MPLGDDEFSNFGNGPASLGKRCEATVRVVSSNGMGWDKGPSAALLGHSHVVAGQFRDISLEYTFVSPCTPTHIMGPMDGCQSHDHCLSAGVQRQSRGSSTRRRLGRRGQVELSSLQVVSSTVN